MIKIFSKYEWVGEYKGNTVTNAFQYILDESNRKPNKIWRGKGSSEFYNRLMKSRLQDNDTEHGEGKSVDAERFIRTLKNKIYIYMTSISKNAYIDELDYIVNEYNSTYHITIKTKPADVKVSTCIDFNVENVNKISNLTLVIMQKYQNKNIFEKGYTAN